jgi:hypothetical protein
MLVVVVAWANWVLLLLNLYHWGADWRRLQPGNLLKISESSTLLECTEPINTRNQTANPLLNNITLSLNPTLNQRNHYQIEMEV